jgi:predicted DNA-binding transcriptional regulator YafY
MHRADLTKLSPILEKVRRASRQFQQIKMVYQSSTGKKPTRRWVDPYALVHRTGWWYLVGYCHLRKALRTFRVDRVQELELTGEPFQVPDDFEIHQYLEEIFAEQPVVKASLRFIPQAAYLAKANLTGWESYKENPDGSIDVILSAPDLYWIASMVLSFATWVYVLNPPELRKVVQDWARGTAEMYEKIENQKKEIKNEEN